MPYKILAAVAFLAIFGLTALLVVGGIGSMMARSASAQSGDAETYCTTVGGKVVERTPALNADSANPMLLANPARFCEFTGGAGADPADSRIVVSLDTLFATQPTRAALAWRERAPLPDPATPAAGMAGMANPASLYCASIGGAEGDWLNPNVAPDDPARVATMCAFPDFSAIDSWGLAYHAQGIVRGADLDSLFHWQEGGLPGAPVT